MTDFPDRIVGLPIAPGAKFVTMEQSEVGSDLGLPHTVPHPTDSEAIMACVRQAEFEAGAIGWQSTSCFRHAFIRLCGSQLLMICLSLYFLASAPDCVLGDERPSEVGGAQGEGLDFFETRIRPVLAEHCYECHSEAAQEKHQLKAELFLDSGNGISASSIVHPEKPAESLLIEALQHNDLKMPPKGKLPDAIISDFEKWVAMGAPVPIDSNAEARNAGIDWEEARNRWAFRSPVLHPIPKVAERNWAKNSIDVYIREQLDQKKLKPVRQATRREWIRRATLDLIGLPPTLEECDAFDGDRSPNAYERVVDRLLASPHYGERWGRHWLDLARYADDQGNSFLTPTPSAYLYRDWVIHSFNRDRPYDEFIRLQIAGDELSEPTNDYVDRLAGLGFQGLGPQFRKGAAGDAKAKADELEDRVDTLSRSLLGLTVSCARCHDHKFDPIPTRDYYSLATAYNGATWFERALSSPELVAAHQTWQTQVDEQTATIQKWSLEQGRRLGYLALPKIETYAEAAWTILVARQHKQTLNEEELARQNGLEPYFLQRWVQHLVDPTIEPAIMTFRTAVEAASADDRTSLPADLRQQLNTLQGNVHAIIAVLDSTENPTDLEQQKKVLSQKQQQLLKTLAAGGKAPFFVDEQNLQLLLKEPAAKHDAQLRADLASHMAKEPPLGPRMPSVSGGGEPMHVFLRGNPEHVGEPAPPGFLQILSRPNEPSRAGSLKRVELAEAIANRDNPLTARVIVNRIWHHHFGRGIVTTLSNFGRLGTPPTHPELLDMLAVRFMQSDWSMKWLHREIMLSATYRLSSDQDSDNMAIDPGNEFLWRMTPRRLDIEAWRDAVVTVAGQLDERIGGPTIDLKNPGIKEDKEFEFFTRMNGFEADNPENRRRTIYSIISRYAPNPALTLFDFPEPNVTNDQRNSTTVPQQQLFVLNSKLMMAMSRQFADRISQTSRSDTERIELAWNLAYSRAPRPEEIAAAVEFLQASANTANTDKLDHWQQLAHALLSSNEFMFLP
ncbi:MAG: PSD1 and planctomycete cytochrome C domain-containing protein [Planctomycetota bacterium]|nr:PSD1 and planctomycete cytochrome C domain-containing protein [Planctomycetota bacterium]MDA1179110.1 PSD1 and planctomycete cytochrome C domain-containing protein [Planctomycetota bacterium]